MRFLQYLHTLESLSQRSATRSALLAHRPLSSETMGGSLSALRRASPMKIAGPVVHPVVRFGNWGKLRIASLVSHALGRSGEQAASFEQCWLIVGLGNPGPRYADTRHNVGFMLVDELARQLNVSMNRLQDKAVVARGTLCDQKILLAKPMTFMNVSGEAVGKLARYYKVPPERIIVVFDDLDIPTAKVRLRAKGGPGGHNGMKSITQHLQGSKDFPRVRIGIGRPPGQQPVPDYVLQNFTKDERAEINIAIQEGIDAVRAILSLGIERAVSGNRVAPSIAR